MTDQEDPILAKLIEANMALEPVHGFMELPVDQLLRGSRSQAEAFEANAPLLYGYERDTERIFMVIDLAVSAIQADPTYGGGYAMAAACVYRLGVQDVDIYDSRALATAIPWAFRATVVDPDCQAGWENYIECHCFKGDFKTAETALGKVFQRFGDNDLYARTAFLYFRLMGNHAQALNWGALAWQTEWDPVRLVHTLFALGHLYRDVGDFGKAMDAYRVITERDHQNSWAYHYAAVAAAALGDYRNALDLNQKAIQYGQLHQFRAYQEDLKKAAGRAKISAGRVTAVPVTKPRQTTRQMKAPPTLSDPPPPAAPVVAAPPPVVAAPPPAAAPVVAAPPPAAKAVPAPPPAAKPVVPAPPPAAKAVPAPPPAKAVPAPPAKAAPAPPAKAPPLAKPGKPVTRPINRPKPNK
jgi:tetratricopeptide (TPR) repeat protein